MKRSMSIGQALQQAAAVLEQAGNGSPAVDAGVLLCHLLGVERIYLYTHRDRILDSGSLDLYFDMIGYRASGVPVQYLTGEQEFMSLTFEVNHQVLIPRSDTEILVEEVIRWCKGRQEPYSILDIGTGSGCIGISLAYYIKSCTVCAVDISEGALETAMKNADRIGVPDKVRFAVSDVFSNIKAAFGEGSFDCIVSNPPYIAAGEIEGLEKQVRCHEPLSALNGGEDGMDFYRKIIKEAPGFLKPGGLLALETGYDQRERVVGLLEEQGCYEKIEWRKDYASLDRVALAVLTST